MESFLPAFNLIVAVGIVTLQIISAIVLVLFIFSKENKVLDLIKKNYLIIGFLITLSAVAVSLFYSDIIGFAPCKLCWLQRIAIYPSCLIFFIAWLRKDRSAAVYVFYLTLFGTLVSLYHNYIYYFGEGIAPCDSSGVSCVQKLVSVFHDYVSIPSMALTGFISILILLAVAHFYKRNKFE